MSLRIKIARGDHGLARCPEDFDRAADFQRLAGGGSGEIFQIKHQGGNALIGRRPANRPHHIIQEHRLIVILINKR